MKRIIVREVIGTELAVSTDNGLKVFHEIDVLLKENETVDLDFQGITVVITAFLNAAIGSLYKDSTYNGDFLNSHLKLKNVDSNDLVLFKDVIQRAKEYFANKESFEKNSNHSIYGKN